MAKLLLEKILIVIVIINKKNIFKNFVVPSIFVIHIPALLWSKLVSAQKNISGELTFSVAKTAREETRSLYFSRHS